MKDWKNLEIDNLPPDILTGVYEFESNDWENHKDWKKANGSPIKILEAALYSDYDFRYRKPEPKHTAETLAEEYILSEPIIYSPEYITQKIINDIKRQAFIAGAKVKIPPEAE